MIALGIALTSDTSYEARATLRLTTPTALSSGNVRPDDIEYTERLENTYAELLESQGVREELGARLGLAKAADVKADARPKSELFDVVGRAPTRAEAVAVTNEAAALLLEEVAAIGTQGLQASDALFEQRITELESELARDRKRRKELVGRKNPELVLERRALLGSIRTAEAALVAQRAQYERERLARGERAGTLSILATAELPESKVGLTPEMTIVLGILVGLAVGVALAFIVENLRPRRHSARQIEDLLQVPVLGRIPANRSPGSVPTSDPDGREDAFRHLRTTLLANLDDRGRGAMLLTGTGDPGQHVGVGNDLARSLAEAGRSVLLVDGNVRSPLVDDGLEAGPDHPGLVDALERRSLPADLVRHTLIAGVSVLPAGRRSERAADLLSSTAMREMMSALRERFDVVLVVGPSLDGTHDALDLASAAGAAVVVVESDNVSLDVVRDARQQLRQVQARVLGFVINDHSSNASSHIPLGGGGVEYA